MRLDKIKKEWVYKKAFFILKSSDTVLQRRIWIYFKMSHSTNKRTMESYSALEWFGTKFKIRTQNDEGSCLKYQLNCQNHLWINDFIKHNIYKSLLYRHSLFQRKQSFGIPSPLLENYLGASCCQQPVIPVLISSCCHNKLLPRTSTYHWLNPTENQKKRDP